MDEARRERLVGRYLEGRLDPAEAEELAAAVRGSPEVAGEVARQILLHRALVQAGRGGIDVDRLMQALPSAERSSVDEVMRSIAAGKEVGPSAAAPRRWRRPSLVVTATALAAAAAAALFLRPRDRADRREETLSAQRTSSTPMPGGPAVAPADPSVMPRLERVSGQVAVVSAARREPALASRRLAAGEGLVTVGAQSSASLSYPDGTRIEVAGDAVLAQVAARASGGGVPAKTIFLARGSLLGHVAAQPLGAPMVLASPHAEAVVLGTRLQLVVTAEATRVAVHEGRLRVAPASGGEGMEVVAGRYALVREGSAMAVAEQPRGGVALLVTGTSDGQEMHPADKAVRMRLQKVGFEVRVTNPGKPGLINDAQNAALVVISSTVASPDVDDRLRHLPVPIVTWEAQLFAALGMTGPCGPEGECGEAEGRHGVLIKDPTHPLAAGLSGQIEVTRWGRRTTWGTPGVLAAWVATLPGNPTRATVFGYDRGRGMPGGLTAPARRVGLFLWDETADGLTEPGWALFDAAIAWSTERAGD